MSRETFMFWWSCYLILSACFSWYAVREYARKKWNVWYTVAYLTSFMLGPFFILHLLWVRSDEI